MIKRLSIICLLMLSMAGVKAQTYCYHCYKYYDFQDIPYDYSGSYRYYTFRGNLLFESEKDGSIKLNSYGYGSKKYPSSIFKLYSKKEGILKYVQIDDNGRWQFDKRYWLVSEDREFLNLVYPYDQPEPEYIEVVKRNNLWFEKVTCFKKYSNVESEINKSTPMRY